MKNILSVIKRLSFTRYGGTDEEKKASEIILAEITELQGTGVCEEFLIPAYNLNKCLIKVILPYEKDIEVVPYGLSGNLPKEGIDLPLIYLEQGSEADFRQIDDLSQHVVLLNELNYDNYKRLVERNAKAFIVVSSDKWYDTRDTVDLIPRVLRPKMSELGKIPGFVIRSVDATELVRADNAVLHLELRQEECEHVSRNILSTIEGNEAKDESIVLTAHYDSVAYGTGSWDNASGSALLLYLYQYYLQNKPKRTMRFIWCGSEEQGLLGSKAYIQKHQELVEKEIKFCFNFDMCGTVLGPNKMNVTGGDDLKAYAEKICQEYGYSTELKVRVHSSDSAPFCNLGIPAVGISRGTKTAQIHTRNDLIYPLGEKQLLENATFAIYFIDKIVNADVLPISLGMPDNIKKALYNYFEKYKKQ